MRRTGGEDEGISAWEKLLKELFGLRSFGIKPGLSRMKEALLREGLAAPPFRVISVAGTNGKGTVSSSLSAILQAHGHRVGFYSSPHLIDVTERFRIQGVPVSRKRAAPVLGRLLREYGAREGGREQGLTFFELTTLAAAVLFKEARVEVGVFEVGLGGRLDAVNSLEPDLSVITTLGKDHTEYLGETVESIAWEKAGIFRAGKPALVGIQEWEGAKEALLEAGRKKEALVEALEAREGQGAQSLRERHFRTAERGAKLFLGEEFDPRKAAAGLQRWVWPGRGDFRCGPAGRGRIFLEGAHNPAGVRALRETLETGEWRPTGVIWAAMSDKDQRGTGEFLEKLDLPVWGSLIDNPRAMSEEELRGVAPSGLLRGVGKTAEILKMVGEWEGEEILVFGSLFLIGEVLAALGIGAEELICYSSP